jgi:GNAT superfamily N-acetyltransferase
MTAQSSVLKDKLSLREAIVADIPRILRLNNLMCEEEHHRYDPLILPNFATTKAGRAYFKGQLTGKDRLLIVLASDDEIIGYLSASIRANENYRQKCKLAELNDMVVDKKYRKRGVGKSLFAYFQAWAKSRKAKRLRVVASSGNKDGLAFYKKSGFAPISTVLEREA